MLQEIEGHLEEESLAREEEALVAVSEEDAALSRRIGLMPLSEVMQACIGDCGDQQTRGT